MSCGSGLAGLARCRSPSPGLRAASASLDAARLAPRPLGSRLSTRDCFGGATVLTIAHRLNTVAFYDRVLVLAQGKMVEFDAPLALLERSDTAFRKLAEGSGDLQGLIRIAKAEEVGPA